MAVDDFSRTADIVCLQETKLAPSERQALSGLSGCSVYYSNLSKASAGVAIVEGLVSSVFFKVPLSGSLILRKVTSCFASRYRSLPFSAF